MFDQHGVDLFFTLALPVFVGLFLLVGGVIHSLHREYREYLKYRKVHARWREICEGDGK